MGINMNIKKELILQCKELDAMLNYSILTDNEFDELDGQIVELRTQISAIIQVEVHEDTEKYKEVAEVIKKANEEIEEAQKDIQDVAKTISRIAKIIDVAAKAAAAAA